MVPSPPTGTAVASDGELPVALVGELGRSTGWAATGLAGGDAEVPKETTGVARPVRGAPAAGPAGTLGVDGAAVTSLLTWLGAVAEPRER